MGCGCKKQGLTDEQKNILQAMADNKEPCAAKAVAETVGMEGKTVSCRITALKKKGYVESPVRCKWQITDAGREILAKS
jgi:Mn-dependent DtxR family transcriptional regulator